MSCTRLFLVVTTLLLLATAGCGKKGQLYLPDTARPAQAGAPSGVAAPEDDAPSLPSAPAAP
jgi:predicted small lipoprotein YifL